MTSLLLAATLATTLGVSGTAFASTATSGAMPLNDDFAQAHFFQKGSFKSATRFKDVTLSDWAIRYIIEMNSKGVINGYGNGEFRPSANVTHEEAIVMAVRAMGLQNEALKLDASGQLQITDSASISDWAKPYVAYALQNGFVDRDTALNPQKGADREWVTELAVRAAGLASEADAHMSDTLAFNDAKAVDADAVGYIAVATDHKIISGYEDHTFQPHKMVARNELAVILSNAQHLFSYDQNQQQQTAGELQGTFKGLTTGGLTFETPSHQQISYKFASTYYVFLGNKIATSADLKQNQWVRVLLNENGEVVFVQAKDQAPKIEDIESTAQGTVSAYTAPSATSFGSITLTQTFNVGDRLGQGHAGSTATIQKQLTLPVAPNADLSGSVQVGSQVKLGIVNNVVQTIKAQPVIAL